LNISWLQVQGGSSSTPKWVIFQCRLTYQEQQPSLFAEERKKEQLARAMDAVNDRFGDFKVTFGSMLDTEEKGSHVISPAWRPEGIRNVG
jgi:DNA polymerase-4